MKILFIVGVGSFFGGVFRYLVSNSIQIKVGTFFPYATLTVNLIGCFLIGCLFGLSEKWVLSLEWRLFFITGLLGGFTTFSAISIETSHLIKSGEILKAIVYIGVSIIAGICLTIIGAWLFRFIPGKL